MSDIEKKLGEIEEAIKHADKELSWLRPCVKTDFDCFEGMQSVRMYEEQERIWETIRWALVTALDLYHSKKSP